MPVSNCCLYSTTNKDFETHFFKGMGELAKAEISLKIAEKFAGGGNALIDACRLELPLIKASKQNPIKTAPSVTHGENESLRGASNLVKLVETKDKGRFMVASDGVKTGDVVLSEDPVAACLLPTFFGSNCHHCFKKYVNSVSEFL